MFHETRNDVHFDATHENYVRFFAFLALNWKSEKTYFLRWVHNGVRINISLPIDYGWHSFLEMKILILGNLSFAPWVYLEYEVKDEATH